MSRLRNVDTGVCGDWSMWRLGYAETKVGVVCVMWKRRYVETEV